MDLYKIDHKIHQRKASEWFYCVPCLQRNGFGRRISAQTDQHLAKDRFIVKNGIEPQKWDDLFECVGDSETAFGQGWQSQKFGDSDKKHMTDKKLKIKAIMTLRALKENGGQMLRK